MAAKSDRELAVKRAYDPPSPDDGARILVDGLWPRGLAREALHLQAWLKELAPSPDLRRWFGHDPAKWDGFRERYFAELDQQQEAVSALRDRLAEGKVTLIYGARDERHNNAVALKEYLERRTGKRASGGKAAGASPLGRPRKAGES